jgi:ribosome recycling factor
MTEEIKLTLDDAREQMDTAVEHLEAEMSKIRAGKASTQMLDGIYVDYYGSRTPLAQVANVNTPDARTLVVQPWEKTLLQTIEKAIQAANLGLNPQNDGVLIRINVPPLTEERRKDLAKKAKAESENGKVTIRNIRRDANEMIKGISKLPEDIAKDAETKIQVLTDTYIAKMDKLYEVKEKEIMTI